jgi:hypothetical protein
MPLAIVLIGILLVSVGVKGTQKELGAQFQKDLLGSQGFLIWFAALLIVGLLGTIKPIQQPARYLLALILIVILLRNNGVFTQAVNAIGTVENTGFATAQPLPSDTQTSSGSSSSSDQTGNKVVGALSSTAIAAAQGGQNPIADVYAGLNILDTIGGP